MNSPIDGGTVEQEFWRPLTDREQTAVPNLVNRAWALLLQQSTGLEDRITSRTVAIETVQQVLLQAVGRVLNNPAGRTQQNSTLDDFSEGWTLAKNTGSLFFTDAELLQVKAVGRAGRGKAFSIDTTPTDQPVGPCC